MYAFGPPRDMFIVWCVACVCCCVLFELVVVLFVGLCVACVFIACCVVLSSVHTYMRVMFMLCVAPGLLICV